MIKKIIYILLVVCIGIPISAKSRSKASNANIKTADIRKFGASLKNPDSNAEAIERAIASGMKVYIPQGTWILTRTVQVSISNVAITGIKGKSILKVEKPQNILQTNAGIKNFKLTNLTFRGVGDKHEASYLVYVGHGASGISVSNCTFDGGTGGLLVDYESSNVTVDRCTFRNMVYIPGAGLATGGHYAAGGAGGYGVVFQQMHVSQDYPNGARGINNGIIKNCTFESTVICHATYIQSSDNIKILNNKVYGTSELNDSTLVSDLLTKGLTPEQVNAINVKKHMTVYDLPFEFRGGKNILVQNNVVYGGLGFSNGTTDTKGYPAENFTFNNNKAYNLNPPKGRPTWETSYINGLKKKANSIK